MRYLAMILFGGMVVAQWFVPGKMIYDSETVIYRGEIYHFKTQPVDPNDPFRGKYITLSFEANSLTDSVFWSPGEEINVVFVKDSAGFALPILGTKDEPSGPYLHTTVLYTSGSNPAARVFFNIPFDRFYLEESKAPEAERQYRGALRDTTQVSYGIVKLGNGTAVLTDVIINGRSVTQIVSEVKTRE